MNNNELFDTAVTAVRDEPIDPRGYEAARERVLSRLMHSEATVAETADTAAAPADSHRILGCDGFRALLPAYAAGALAEPKRVLVEDHTRECLGCRRALAELRRGAAQVATASPRTGRSFFAGRGRLALAAALTGIAVLSGAFAFRAGAFRAAPTAVVQAIDGELSLVDATTSRAAIAGESFGGASAVRTGGGSGAVVVLADGSKVELAERSELALGKRWDGTVLKLARGSVIVEAAEQRRGHLYVETSDCQVSVVGTIFAVNAGTKGSRVSVIDGEVHVRQGVERAVLRPGDQLATGRRLRAVPVDQEISWSRNAARYREQLAALKALGRELDQTLVAVGTRHSTRLLDLAPAGTTVYVALPNLSQSLGSAWDLVVQRAAENPALADWWNERFSDGGDAEIARAIDEIERFGGELGDEIAVSVALPPGPGDAGDHPDVTLLAVVTNPQTFSEVLDSEIDRLNNEDGTDGNGHGLRIRRVFDPADASSTGHELLVWLADDLLVAATSPDGLAAVAQSIADGENPFVGSSLRGRIARVYDEGTDWVLGVDLASVIRTGDDGGVSDEHAVQLDRIGIDELENLIIDRTDGDGVDPGQSRAVLAFSGDRHGLASWLAAPAPLGAFEFVSPSAHAAVAGILKEPAAMFDDLLAVASSVPQESEGATSGLAELESRLGISIRQDLAASFGGDFAVAFDGPWLPEPSWKIVLEVVDPGLLQSTVRTLVESWNREAAEQDKPALRLSQESVGGRRIFTLATEGDGTSGSSREIAHGLIADGYLLIGPSRALLLEAVAQRDSGIQLANSSSFRELLPTDGRAHVSGLVYQDLGESLGTLGQLIGRHAANGEGAGGENPATALSELVSEAGPGLAVVYADGREISFVTKGLRGPLGLSFESLLSLGGLLGHETGLDGPEVDGSEEEPFDEEAPPTSTARFDPATETPLAGAA